MQQLRRAFAAMPEGPDATPVTIPAGTQIEIMGAVGPSTVSGQHLTRFAVVGDDGERAIYTATRMRIDQALSDRPPADNPRSTEVA